MIVNAGSYPLWDAMTRIELKNADYNVVVGNTLKDEFVDCYDSLMRQTANRLAVIPNGIDFDKFKAFKSGNPVSKVEGSAVSIIFYGRLYWRKGILQLLNAIHILLAQGKNVNLNIYGTGPLVPKIQTMINQLGMNSHVQLNGYVPYDVLLTRISESDIVALPSIYEVGAFIAALEAMALKKAVVAFDYPFTRQLLSDGNTGLLAKGEDAKDLARCINLFAEDKTLRLQMGNNAFEHIQKNHNWAILVNRYLEIYQQLTECC